MSKIALIDIDNVLADTNATILSRFREVTGREPATCWHSNQNSDQDNILLSMIKSRPDFWLSLPIIISGFKIADALSKIGYDIHFISGIPTHTYPDALNQKLRFLESAVLASNYRHKIHFTQDRSILRGDVLVDDAADFIPGWRINNPTGKVIMPTYDYNKDILPSSGILNYKPYDSSNTQVWVELLNKFCPIV